MITKLLLTLIASASIACASQLDINIGGEHYLIPADSKTVVDDTIPVKFNGVNMPVGIRLTFIPNGNEVVVREETLAYTSAKRRQATVETTVEVARIPVGGGFKTVEGREYAVRVITEQSSLACNSM